MKRRLYHLIVCLAGGVLLSACHTEEIPDAASVVACNDIVLDMSLPASRAAAEGPEVAIDHIDVLIFKSSDESLVWHERVTDSPDAQGRITLAARRTDFEQDGNYWVYLVANSTHGAEEFASLADLTGLRSMVQEDRRIHLTGLANVPSAPKSFLMDGVAYPAGYAQEPVAAAPVVLYNGRPADNTELKAVLRRAAAKIVIRISRGDAVVFDVNTPGVQPGYYLRNMPYSTSLISGVDGTAELFTPPLTTTDYFEQTPESIVVTAYTYAHEWVNESTLEQEVRMVVNIPMIFQGVSYPNSYYQIPVSREKALARNTYYEVAVTVSAPGGPCRRTREELRDLTCSTCRWEDPVRKIGGEGGRPVYLTVNETEMEMHSISEDGTTLQFASSSEVSTRVTRVYYYDKFGQKQETTDPSAITAMGILTAPDSGLTGYIRITSPLPTNNTIRYMEMEVTNEDGVTRTVMIAQYPLEYITNILGWYSYRDDFEGTTYEMLNGRKKEDVEGVRFDANSRITSRYCACSWSSNRWNYYNTASGFFKSKVAGDIVENGSDAGKAYIYTYRWYEDEIMVGMSVWPPYIEYEYEYSRLIGDKVWDDYANPRMYHVRITASSTDYTLGRPRMTADGITDPGLDNAELVSPSFMIASQLGAVTTTTSVDVAASHCEQYVEVYQDATTGETVHLNDWRLPTKAELEIIMKYQHTSDAMDEVLAGQSYWSASGLVFNNQASASGSEAIRCIRDVY